MAYARDMAELTMSVITPLTEKIRELTYSKIAIEKDVYAEDTSYLVEAPYTLEELIKPVNKEIEPKVIAFIK